jgi:tetratricopeptide (TPR) repeat protein
MSGRQRDLVRFRDRGADASALDARAAILAEAARDVQVPDAAALARIRSAVHARSGAARAGMFAWPRVRRIVVFAGTFAVVALMAASAARALWSRHVRTRALLVEGRAWPPAQPRHASQAIAATRVDLPAPEEPTPPPVPPEPRRLALAPPAERRATAAPPSEAATLARALSELRKRKDPTAALALLDLHDRQFPHGVLRTEALRARAEALVASGDLDAALALLDGQTALGDGLGSDLLLARAELRAAKARYREALTDFDVVLGAGRGLSPADRQRALYGRAVCLGHLGNDREARAGLLDYQRQFPEGRFAAEVARLLGRSGSAAGPP